MASNQEQQKKPETLSERERKFLTPEEAKAKEMKYLSKLMELKKCLKFIEDAQFEIDKLQEEQLLQEKWQDFLSCNILPKPYIPPDIRLFYAKLKYWERENVKNNISWLLSVNERSILSQDIFSHNLTYNKLNATLRKNIGHEYDSYIRGSLSILQRIEYFLENRAEIAKCPVRILDDIVKRKLAIQQEIVDFMDRFTYRVVSSENAEMNSIDGITAEYFFNASDFDIHIWCLKNVALRFSHLSEPRLIANFSSINLKLQIPADMLKQNLVVRALHMKFDHVSENAKSYHNIAPASTANFNLGTLDLANSLRNEWSMQVDLQNKKLNEMKQKCAEYEVLKQHYVQQVEEQKQRRKAEDNTRKKKEKIIRIPKEPMCFEDDRMPDIYEEFLEEEQKQFENCTKNPFKPELLNLTADEINLRKYDILGGIYQVYYVLKPLHTDFSSFNMTWHKNESKLQIEKNIKIEIGSGNKIKSQTRLSRRITKRMSVTDMQKRLGDPDIGCPWFILTFELPEHLCYWGSPTACYFEETSTTSKQLQLVQTVELKDSVSKTASISLSSSQQNAQPLESEDSSTSLKPVQINDFSLLEILTKPQIRNIERHILPRIISSYKFPKEAQQDDAEVLSNKSKSKGGKILRQKTFDVQQNFSNKNFTFDDRQNNPERIYTIHSKAEHVDITSLLKKIHLLSEKEPETFAQLLQIINDIKKKYKSNKSKLLCSNPFDQQIVTHNKRIKQMLKQKLQTTSSKDASNIASLSTKVSAHKSVKLDTKLTSSKVEIHKIKKNEQQSKHEDEHSYTKNEDSDGLDDEQNVEELKVLKYSHWTTEHISKCQFDRTNRRVVIHTDRLGNFGFAFKRYEHFPFKYWTLDPSKNDPVNEVVFTLDTQYVRCVLFITDDGIRGHVTEPTKTFKRNPKMYLAIEKPIKDLKAFKQLFKEKYLNIFADHDAGFYIENGYFSEKHLPNELHSYNCMAVHSTQISFNFSLWNRLAARRDIILKFRQYQDLIDNLVEVRIMPGEAYFVEIQELCSEDLDIIKLDYSLTWRNIEPYSDLHHLIVSMYPAATDLRCKNPKLICFVRDLLSEIRPLSFS